MWAWLRSPRGSTTTAVAVAALLALFFLAPWNKPWPALPGLAPEAAAPLAGGTADGSSPATGSGKPVGSALSGPAPAAPSPVPPAAVATGAAPAAGAPASASSDAGSADAGSANAGTVASGAAAPKPGTSATATASAGASGQAGSTAAGAQPSGAAPVPAFDIVRVEPSGATVVAGRGAPGSVVVLSDSGREIGRATVDGSGQFALLPPDLKTGDHFLTLQSLGVAAATDQAGRGGVAVVVPASGTAGRAVVAMLSPDQAPRVLSDGSPAAPAAAAPLAIQAVEASNGGKFAASGVAKAGSQSRIYLNGAFLADVVAGKDGRWSVRVEKGMRPGPYVVRADEIEGGSGKVVHRAEVPFTYPATVGTGKRMLMSRSQPIMPGKSGAPSGGSAPPRVASASPDAAGPVSGPPDTGPVSAAIVADLRTATVSRGDSLWRLSRKLLGRGIKYTEIYASNAGQIRDPALIYPGQIFVLPQGVAR